MSSTSASTPPLTTWELVKMTGPIILFGILLPTVDNLTDLRMIIRLYTGITGCKFVDPDNYNRETNGTWEDLITCQQNPNTYCRLNPGFPGCGYRPALVPGRAPVSVLEGVPSSDFPGCRWDFYTCNSDPDTFCEDNPHRLTSCVYYQHEKFATMFLGIFIL